jgi:hypothetical protein
MGVPALDAIAGQLLASRRPGRPRGGGRLWVIPLLGPPLEGATPTPLHALPAGASVRLSERDAQARVEEVQAYNGTDAPLLALEGELLAGGYQDRMLSASVLIPGDAAAMLPTTCSEEGRFAGDNPHLQATGRIASPRYRRRLRLGLYGDAGHADGPESRQQAVWHDIETDRRTLDLPGEGVSLLRLRAAAEERCRRLADSLGASAGESGWIMFIDDRLAGADIFGSPELATAYGPPLLAAAAYDGLVEGLRSGPTAAAGKRPGGKDFLLGFWRELTAELDSALVVREEGTSGAVRLSLDSPALVATALTFGAAPIHLSLFPALYADDVTALP